MDGWITQLEAKNLEIECPDHRVITFQLTDNTKKAEALKPGDYVKVEATEDDRGFFTATSVAKGQNPPVRESAAPMPPAEGQPAATEAPPVSSAVVKPPPAVDPDDEGPPQLKRGIPKPRKRTARKEKEEEQPVEAPVETATAAPAPDREGPAPKAQPQESMIDRARAASESFLSGLPNYVCQQFTTRYFSEGGQ